MPKLNNKGFKVLSPKEVMEMMLEDEPALNMESHTLPWSEKYPNTLQLGRNVTERKKPLIGASALFRLALAEYQRENNINMFSRFLDLAQRNPTVMVALMNKLLPNKTQAVIAPEDIRYLLEKVSDVIARHVKDEPTLQLIIKDLQEISVPESGEMMLESPGVPVVEANSEL